MPHTPLHVLILCTGNSARSILGECLLERLGEGRVRGHSAGSHPKDAPHPLARSLLEARGYDTTRLRSKSWDEFAAPDAPPIDVVLTVCDAARAETCPVWPGHPVQAHWGLPDPAACEGSEAERRAAFEDAYRVLEHRVHRLLDLPLASLDREALGRALEAIGREIPEPSASLSRSRPPAG
jgi:protein-tyrosine-phosphatase